MGIWRIGGVMWVDDEGNRVSEQAAAEYLAAAGKAAEPGIVEPEAPQAQPVEQPADEEQAEQPEEAAELAPAGEDLDSMTTAQLLEVAQRRGITIKARTAKPDILKAIKEASAS